MIRNYKLLNEKITECPSSESTIQVIISPDDIEKRQLIDELKLDEHTLNSSLDPDELSRLEFEPRHIALIYKRPKNFMYEGKIVFKIASTGLYLFQDKLLIVLSEDIPIFDNKLFLKVLSLPDLLLKMINRSIFHFLEHLRTINMISEELEDKINTSMENSYLLNLFTLGKSLVYYLNSINSNGVLLEKLRLNNAKIGFNQQELELLEDIIIDNNQCYKEAEIYSNILASLMDARASIVGNNLNVLMKTLNIITIGIMVPTFVVSAFSMNVHIPLEDYPFSFWIIMAFAAISVMGFFFFWKKKKW
ncbi:MAG TPA: magnesium transporter CorA family protein [Ignavibacteriaceae bacterium]|nr:magnesium transporter CorA family protein [Ignavibacteriaceae bacterium]